MAEEDLPAHPSPAALGGLHANGGGGVKSRRPTGSLTRVAASQVTAWNLEVEAQLVENTNQKPAISAPRNHNRAETKEALISPDVALYENI